MKLAQLACHPEFWTNLAQGVGSIVDVALLAGKARQSQCDHRCAPAVSELCEYAKGSRECAERFCALATCLEHDGLEILLHRVVPVGITGRALEGGTNHLAVLGQQRVSLASRIHVHDFFSEIKGQLLKVGAQAPNVEIVVDFL